MLQQVLSVMVGTDPEAFFARGGRIIGSEKVIPDAGLYDNQNYHGTVVQDGIQLELHPVASPTVAALGQYLGSTFQTLQRHMRKHEGVTLVFNSVVDIEQAEIDSLSEKSQQFLCQPSKNLYGLQPQGADAKKYLKRSAGGHIHLGVLYGADNKIYNPTTMVDERYRIVGLCDPIVGNMGVLFDRDPGAPERRKNYGMAGEYRLPSHGVEYRVLSNFWLRSYPIMSLMMGLAKTAVDVLHVTTQGSDLEAELLDSLDIGQVITAIQSNDKDLALLNYKTVGTFLAKHCSPNHPIHAGNVDKFDRFLAKVDKVGLEGVFPDDPFAHWCDPSTKLKGWNQWLNEQTF